MHTRDRLADLYDQLYVNLAEHLDAEETRVLPLVARCITPTEWARLGEAGQAGIKRSDMALVFGMMMYEGDPEVVAMMLAPAPLPVRLLVPAWVDGHTAATPSPSTARLRRGPD